MGQRATCPRCQHPKSWNVRRGKRRCAACRYEWTPDALPLRLTRAEWRRLLRWFLLGHSAAVIAWETRLNRKRVLRALHLVRRAMADDVPLPFADAVELDETVRDRLRKETAARPPGGTRNPGRGTIKRAVFWIMWREGQVRAEILADVDAKAVLTILKPERQMTLNVERLHTHTGIAARGHIYRLVSSTQVVRSGPGGRHNPLAGFWGYLKRRLAAKGGIRRDRLPLYLAEYVWRYNHRSLSPADQVKRLLKLIQR